MCTENAFSIFIDNLNGLLFHDLEALYLLGQILYYVLCLTLHSFISLILVVYIVTYGV